MRRNRAPDGGKSIISYHPGANHRTRIEGNMTDVSTCGEGLAAHAAFHAKLAALMETIGRNLELHLASLDPNDEVSRPEFDAYTSLVERHRDLAERLRLTAEEMASYEDLPMGNHDADALASPSVVDAFRTMINEQEALASMLTEWVEQDRAMLEGGDSTEDAE